MDIQSIIIVFAIYLSVFVGIIIGRLAKEEMRDAKYIRAFQNVLFAIMMYLALPTYLGILLSILTLLFLFSIKSNKRDYALVPVVGLISGSQPIAQPIAIAYLIASGSLIYDRPREALYYSIYVLTAIAAIYLGV